MRGYVRGSILPKIAGTPTPHGMRVVVDRTGTGELVSWGCAIVAFLAGGALVVADLLGKHPKIGSDISFVTVAIGLIAALQQVYLRRRFRKGSLLVTPWPVRLGSHVEAELRAFVRGEEAAPSARIECVEEAVSGKGTRYEQKKTATIYSCDLPPAELQWNKSMLHAKWSFDIPASGPSSFDAPGQRLAWQVAARIPTGAGETAVEFPLLVVPEVVK
jgi:hypothetical protein